MDERHLEVDEVRLTLLNGGDLAARSPRIAHLTFDYLRQLMERELQELGADVTITRLAPPPVHISLDTSDDEAVARASAEGLYRALRAAL